MKRPILTILILSSILLFSGCLATKNDGNYNSPITVGSKNLMVEIVNSDESRSKGLSGRPSLAEDQGMLFDFTNSEYRRPNFWMKDMKFDIDIIWINNNEIVGITDYVPATYNNVNLPTYSPPKDITHVLEVNSGWTERNNVNVGDKIYF